MIATRKAPALAPSLPEFYKAFTEGGENMEQWKDIRGYEGLYQVSDLGKIRTSKGKNRKQTLNKNGYLYVNLSKNGIAHNYPVHRLVAFAFVKVDDERLTVNHKNEIKTDNRACNLEWMTLEDNLHYGTHFQRVRESRKGKLTGPSHFNYGKFGADSHTHKGKVIGVSVDDPNKVVEFPTAADAARALKISSGQLCDTLKGKYKTCGGYYWRRIDG